jgi:hypothetical protein
MHERTHLLREPAKSARLARETPRRTGPKIVPWPAPDRAHVGLLILFGPEVRAFLQSGFARRLAEHFRVSVITANPASAAFSEAAPWQVYQAPEMPAASPLQRLRGLDRRIHHAWMQSRWHARWRHEPLRNGEARDARANGIFGARAASAPAAGALANRDPRAGDPEDNASARAHATDAPPFGVARSGNDRPLWLRTANFVERSLGRWAAGGKLWERFYEELALDCLVAADYSSPSAVEALLAASRKGVSSVVLANSWKDAYTHSYVTSPPTFLGVSGQAEAQYLRGANPHLAAHPIAVVGSLHLERFLRPDGIPGRAEFCRQAGLDASRPFLCYTAAAPAAVSNEESIVEAMLAIVKNHPSRPQVLLRLNPREDGERFRPLRARFGNLVLQKPRWEWDPRHDWNAPLAADLDTWAATVHHATFNVSIPSTVTLEFHSAGRLVVNVCFDAKPQPPETSNARFWDAPFYQRVRNSPFVAGAFSESEFRELLTSRLDAPGAWRLSAPRRDTSPVDEAERLVWSALAMQRKPSAPGGAV